MFVAAVGPKIFVFIIGLEEMQTVALAGVILILRWRRRQRAREDARLHVNSLVTMLITK